MTAPREHPKNKWQSSVFGAGPGLLEQYRSMMTMIDDRFGDSVELVPLKRRIWRCVSLSAASLVEMTRDCNV